MVGDRSGNVVFEEKLIPSHRKTVGLLTYRRLLWYAIFPLRIVGLCMIVLLCLLVSLQAEENLFEGFIGPMSVIADIAAFLAILIIFYLSEQLLLVNRGMGLRPLRIYENGLSIPPIYFRALLKDGDFVPRDKIDHIAVRRRRMFFIRLQENDALIWYNAPVEFVVHMKNGAKRRSGPRPPEAIKAAVDVMRERWGVRVEQQGSGNGQRVRAINRKRVEVVDL